MPLRNDGNYRGRHACHVEPHPKLGVHRTMIHAAFDLVCALLERDEVLLVELGKMAHGRFTPRLCIDVDRRTMRLLLATSAAAQGVVVRLADESDAGTIKLLIEEQWRKESLKSEAERRAEFAAQ